MLKPGPCTKYCLLIYLFHRLSIDDAHGCRPYLKFTKMSNVKVVHIQTYLRWTGLYIGLGYHKICI